jgi:hypothetical protein
MKLPCRKSDIEFIQWTDAVGESTRYTLDDAKKLTLAVNCNIGFVVDEDEHRVVLALGVSTSGELDVFCIPVVNIVERMPVIGKPKKKAVEAPGEAPATAQQTDIPQT